MHNGDNNGDSQQVRVCFQKSNLLKKKKSLNFIYEIQQFFHFVFTEEPNQVQSW